MDAEPARPCEETKDVRVKIPVHQRIKLQALRLMHDRTLSETVQRALELYFRRLDDDVLPEDLPCSYSASG